MDPGLERVIKIFNKHNIEYWLDSGTLLGVIRDGDIPKGDDDIDISICTKDVEKLKPIINELKPFYKEQKGIRFVPESTILKPVNKKGYYISIHYYHKEKEFVYCFVRARRPKKIKKGSLRWIFWIFPQIIYNLFGKRKNTLDPRIHPLGKFNYFIGERIMYKIPIDLLNKTKLKKLNNKLYGRVPLNYEKYLSFCYGNWKIPNENWKSEDDGRSIFVKDWIKETK